MSDIDAFDIIGFIALFAWFMYIVIKIELWVTCYEPELKEIEKLRADNLALIELHRSKKSAYLHYNYDELKEVSE
jgi:hypothetical protein